MLISKSSNPLNVTPCHLKPPPNLIALIASHHDDHKIAPIESTFYNIAGRNQFARGKCWFPQETRYVNIFIRWRARVAWHIVNVEALKSNCLAPLTHAHTRVWPTIWLEFSHKYATRRGQLVRRWLLLPENISTQVHSNKYMPWSDIQLREVCTQH